MYIRTSVFIHSKLIQYSTGSLASRSETCFSAFIRVITKTGKAPSHCSSEGWGTCLSHLVLALCGLGLSATNVVKAGGLKRLRASWI